MKKTIITLANLLIITLVMAQAPEKMSYQAVIRNSTNALVTNTQIGMEINIHQGSAAGTIVYTETLTPTTNANGLVSIEIGGATGFNSIDWANGPYFLETKTATTAPLTTYTITGTSQLLSVPYALHAKTAGNGFSGNYNDLTNRPTLFGGNYDSLSNKPNIKDTVTMYGFSGNYNDLTNKPTTDGSETIITAGTNVTITGSGTTANPYIVNSANTHYVGELYGGGVVFWVDQTGNHGLICSMTDLSTGIIWTPTAYQSITVPGGALSDWDGQGNTNAIVAQAGAGTSYAAGLCDAYTNTNYGTGIYSDWYLPSRGELNHLWNNIYQVQKTLDTDGNPATTAIAKLAYWSSSEYTNNGAWYFYFVNGTTTNNSSQN